MASTPSCGGATRERDYGAFLEVVDLGSPLITGGDVRAVPGKGPLGVEGLTPVSASSPARPALDRARTDSGLADQGSMGGSGHAGRRPAVWSGHLTARHPWAGRRAGFAFGVAVAKKQAMVIEAPRIGRVGRRRWL